MYVLGKGGREHVCRLGNFGNPCCCLHMWWSVCRLSAWIPGDECSEVIGPTQQVSSGGGNLAVNGTGPDNVTVCEGETAVFNCSTSDPDMVEWLIDCMSTALFDGDVTFNSTQLTILDVTRSHNGTQVTCFVNSTMGVLFESSAYLIVTCECVFVCVCVCVVIILL